MEVSTEDYLKAIFNLQQVDSGTVKTLAISERLKISPAAVSEMLRKLSDKGLVNHAPYRGVSLTKKGVQSGRNMVRRHRILEMYLYKVLDFPWDQLHEEAERLEHAASDALIDRLEEKLRFPKFDPHGSPIPERSC